MRKVRFEFAVTLIYVPFKSALQPTQASAIISDPGWTLSRTFFGERLADVPNDARLEAAVLIRPVALEQTHYRNLTGPARARDLGPFDLCA